VTNLPAGRVGRREIIQSANAVSRPLAQQGEVMGSFRTGTDSRPGLSRQAARTDAVSPGNWRWEALSGAFKLNG